jgi:ABC-type dipeptide/oligopeptide/nickel transport system permease component
MRFVLKRLVHNGVVLAVLVVVVSLLMRLGPDPVTILEKTSGLPISPAVQKQLRHEWGLDLSPLGQVLHFAGGLLHGNMGRSIIYDTSVRRIVLDALPQTLEITLAAMVLGLIIAVPLGLVAALRRDSLADLVGSVAALVGFATPTFLFGVVLIYIFTVRLGWLPSFGDQVSVWKAIRDGSPGEFVTSMRSLCMPALALAVPLGAVNARMIRSAMLESLRQDFVRFARAKGMPERVVIRHAARNALIPVVTIFGIELGSLLGGAIIVENVFAWPGLGRVVVAAIESKDLPVVQGVVLVTAALFLTINLVVDVLYAAIDPRIRLR